MTTEKNIEEHVAKLEEVSMDIVRYMQEKHGLEYVHEHVEVLIGALGGFISTVAYSQGEPEAMGLVHFISTACSPENLVPIVKNGAEVAGSC